MSVLDDMRLRTSGFELNLEWVKIFETIGMEWLYFVWAKDMNFRRSEMECYRPKTVFPHAQIHKLLHNPQCDQFWGGAFGKQLDHEGETLMNGIIALMNEVQESFLFSSTKWGHVKMATHEPGSWFSADTALASTLTLDFQASRKPPSLWRKRWIN